ncbi:adenine nucleotide alpha hydrolases-like protein [Xylariaceae sp. FL1019]|nr:adenine nucleotide alpha hydrolases-like protein [Xylariaceae sp. FL1019]
MIQVAGDRPTVAAFRPDSPVNGYPAMSKGTQPSANSLHSVCCELGGKLDKFLAEDAKSATLRNVQARVREAVGVVDEALERYSPEEISLSYNGGKDCLVLLIILLACLSRRSTQSNGTNDRPDAPPLPPKLQSIYIVSPHPFAEIDEFVERSCAEYHLENTRYELGMKQGLEKYLAERPNIKAIFVGTRRTDPHGEKLTHFDPTDAGWPDFMRIHPVIDWHYADIWAFIRHLDIPYCPLYDQGYTSLGGTEDTHPNPNLKQAEGSATGFLPAYVLVEDEEERLGRDR